jgi:hypothetical protein
MATIFKTCPLFFETLKKHGNAVVTSLDNFKKTKEANAMAPFGSKDRPFSGDGPFGMMKPRLIHAGMTKDISLFYYISGQNPQVISLYGFFTHDESGIGQPPRPSIQKAMVKKFSNQQFK